MKTNLTHNPEIPGTVRTRRTVTVLGKSQGFLFEWRIKMHELTKNLMQRSWAGGFGLIRRRAL